MTDNRGHIELKLHGQTYRTTLLYDDVVADKLKDDFSRLLVCAGFSPSVIDDSDGGAWVWLADNEKIVKDTESENNS